MSINAVNAEYLQGLEIYQKGLTTKVKVLEKVFILDIFGIEIKVFPNMCYNNIITYIRDQISAKVHKMLIIVPVSPKTRV